MSGLQKANFNYSEKFGTAVFLEGRSRRSVSVRRDPCGITAWLSEAAHSDLLPELHQGWLDLLILRKRLRGLSHGQVIAKTIEFNLGR